MASSWALGPAAPGVPWILGAAAGAGQFQVCTRPLQDLYWARAGVGRGMRPVATRKGGGP